MIAAQQRSDTMEIGVDTVSTVAADDKHNAVDLKTEANCWVDIGPTPDAGDPTESGTETSFYMAEGERIQKICDEGDKVSVVAAA